MNEENLTGAEFVSQDAAPNNVQQPVPPQLEQVQQTESFQGGAAVQTEAVSDAYIPPVTENPPTAPTPDVDESKILAEQAAETEKQMAQQQEQDQRLLDALDEVLEKRSKRLNSEEQQRKRPRTFSEKAADTVAKRGIGFVSLGFILIFMGIVMIATLSAATPNYTIPLKLSPVCAILIGVEILANQILTHGRPRVHIPSVVISVLVVTGCCIICAKLGGDYKEETVLYNNRTMAGEIYDKSYKELKSMANIASVKVDVNLNPDGSGKIKGIEALSSGDIVDIDVEFGGVYNSPGDFAKDCKKIIDCYRLMGIYITDFHFKNESKLRSYTLNVEGKYAQDYDESRLEEDVNFVYVDDHDYIEDLDDYEETSDESSTSSN